MSNDAKSPFRAMPLSNAERKSAARLQLTDTFVDGGDPASHDGRLSNKPRDKFLLRAQVNLARRAHRSQSTLVHDENAIGHRERFPLVVRDVKDRHARRFMGCA